MSENTPIYASGAFLTDDSAWKRLETVMHQMIRMRLFQKDQENYQKLKDSYE